MSKHQPPQQPRPAAIELKTVRFRSAVYHPATGRTATSYEKSDAVSIALRQGIVKVTLIPRQRGAEPSEPVELFVPLSNVACWVEV